MRRQHLGLFERREVAGALDQDERRRRKRIRHLDLDCGWINAILRSTYDQDGHRQAWQRGSSIRSRQRQFGLVREMIGANRCHRENEVGMVARGWVHQVPWKKGLHVINHSLRSHALDLSATVTMHNRIDGPRGAVAQDHRCDPIGRSASQSQSEDPA
jgi:hypothetical protein